MFFFSLLLFSLSFLNQGSPTFPNKEGCHYFFFSSLVIFSLVARLGLLLNMPFAFTIGLIDSSTPQMFCLMGWTPCRVTYQALFSQCIFPYSGFVVHSYFLLLSLRACDWGRSCSLEVDMVSVLYVLSAGDLVLGFVCGSSICPCHNLQNIISLFFMLCFLFLLELPSWITVITKEFDSAWIIQLLFG